MVTLSDREPNKAWWTTTDEDITPNLNDVNILQIIMKNLCGVEIGEVLKIIDLNFWIFPFVSITFQWHCLFMNIHEINNREVMFIQLFGFEEATLELSRPAK